MTHVIAAGLGAKAEKLLTHKGIEVIAGPPRGTRENWLSNTLKKPRAPGPPAVPTAPRLKQRMQLMDLYPLSPAEGREVRVRGNLISLPLPH